MADTSRDTQGTSAQACAARARRWLLCGVLALSLAAPVSASAAGVNVKVHRVLESGGSEPVTLVVGVVDNAGEPVKDLLQSNFSVDIKGARSKLHKAKVFVDSGQPFGTMLLIDTSCSMKKSMDKVKQAAHRYVEGMEGRDVAMIAQFNDDVLGIDGAWSGDPQVLGDQIDALEVAGSTTHLLEAMNRAVDAIAGTGDAPSLRSILVLSDGKDEGSPSHLTWESATRKSLEHKVSISAVGYVVNAQDDNTAALEDLAADTGGRYSPARNVDDIAEQFRDTQESIHKLWVLRVDVGALPAGSHQVTVSVTAPGSSKTSHKGTSLLELDQERRGQAIKGLSDEQKKMALMVGIAAVLVLGLGIPLAMRSRRASAALEERVSQASTQAIAAQQAHQASLQELEETRRKAQAAEADSKRALKEAEAAQLIAVEAAEEASQRSEAVEPAPAPVQAPRPRKTMYNDPSAGGAASAGARSARLVAGNGVVVELFASASQDSIRVGSDPGRCDIVVNEETVSGLHASFALGAGGTVLLEDLGSANGTYVDGSDIRGRGAVTVQLGQRVQLGLFQTVLQGE